MVMMGDPFVGNVGKKLSKEELVQALRVDIAGELEAIMAYDAHALATDDQRAKAILYAIRDEERQHVGELVHLMEILDPQEAQFLAKGKQEVDQILNQRNLQGQPAGQPAPAPAGQAGQQGIAMGGFSGPQSQGQAPAQGNTQWNQGGQPFPGVTYQPPGNLGHRGPHNWR